MRRRNHFWGEALTYRITVITADLLLLWAVFGSIAEATLVTAIRHIVQTGLFWYHERFWAKRRWGILSGRATRRRTLLKSAVFRGIAIMNDIIIMFVITGDPAAAGAGTALVAVTNTVIFYVHERAWERFRRS